MNIPSKGDLGDYSLPRILIALNREKVTGTLFITTPHFEKNIYLKAGDAIFASSSLDEDRLGKLLVRSGKITEGQYNSSFELFLKATGKRHGTILVDHGFITPEELIWGVKYQVREIICSLFFLETGAYEFEEGFPRSKEVITLNMDTGSLIYEGVSRIDNLSGIENKLPEPETVFSLYEDIADMFRQTEVSERDKRVLSLVDGKRTIKQVLAEASMDFPEAQKALYVLWRTNLIVEREKATYNEGDEVAADAFRHASEDEIVLKEQVDKLYDKLNAISADELLQVDEHMDADDVKKRYYVLAKEFHPDRAFNMKDTELRDKLTVIFGAIASAYGLLSDDIKRKEYFSSLKKMTVRHENAGNSHIKEQLIRGIQELKKGNYSEASELFRWLTSQIPEDPKFWSYLSLALLRSQGRLKEAETAILQAITLEPLNSEYVTNLASIYQKAGLGKRARVQFEKALKLDPENMAARKGLTEVEQAG